MKISKIKIKRNGIEVGLIRSPRKWGKMTRQEGENVENGNWK